MPEGNVTLIKGDKVDPGFDIDYRDALPVNMYAVKRKILNSQGYMVSYPGLEKIGDGTGVDRGANYNERFKEHYRVSGEKLIKVDEFGAVTELGDVPGTSQTRLIGNYSFNTQSILADGNKFLYDPIGGFRQVTDPDLGNPIDETWADGYYMMIDEEYVFHTDLTDETAIDPLKFATAEFIPDPNKGIWKTQDNFVVVAGRYSLEYFDNRANANFAWTRVESRAQKIGIVATHAKCESGGKYYITGGRRDEAVGVHIISLGNAEKVSTREVDKIIKQYTEPDLIDMRMECRTEDDVTFIIIHLPNETLCFNESIAKSFGKNEAWAILKTGTGNDTYRAINGVNDARTSKWVYGDKISTNIGVLNNAICTQYDEISEWLLFTPIMKLESMSIDEIEIETIPGHTDTKDAKVAFSLTYDGFTYGAEYFNLYGDPQKYNHRFYLRRLGNVNDWIGFKFRGATKSRMAFSLVTLRYS
jgi:hypothetical protein